MAAAASSSCDPNDVFINFRGKDTRKGFVSHLLKRLRQKPFKTYIDAENLRKGARLNDLLAAIEVSRLSIVVLSQNYASSTWTLKELVEILKCKGTKNQIVLPIFFEVETSDISNLRGSFAEAFAKHERSSKVHVEEVQRWKDALVEVTLLSGFNSKDYKDEAELVEKIVEDVCSKLNNISSTSSKGNDLVEMDSHMHEMHSLLYPPGVEMNDVRVVGIWGMGGLGKTTIARAVYDNMASRFEACCFLENVKEGFMKHGELHMQKQLLSSILGYEVRSFDISNKGFEVMLGSLGQTKVLIVVDDVDKLSQIQALIGKQQHSFGGGSRIIITTRDKQLLSKADEVYEPNFLSASGALQLFRQHAFITNEPTTDFDDLSQRVIQYAQGLPLALKEMGDFLVNKTVHEWNDELEKGSKILKKEIHEVLKTSFYGLDDEKDVFLDIAFFFIGMKIDHVTKILKCCGFHAHSGLSVLINRALITVSKWGDLEMHNLLQKMGQNVVCEQSIKEPGKRTRLCNYDDVHRVLTEKSGTEAVESINLDLQNSDGLCLDAEAFVPMTRLRLLKIHHAGGKLFLIGNLKFLSGELRCLSWIEFPLKSLPSNFRFKNLVDLDMQYSLIDRLWEGTQILEKLKFINLSHCQFLKETPDFTNVPNLEKLILQSCMSLTKVHPSFSTLTNLVLLNLNGCKELKSLPSISRMKSLKNLEIFGCPRLENIPEILEFKKKLSKLNLSKI